MEPYCLVLFLESEEVGVVKYIPERDIPIARAQGWHLLGRDSDMWPPPDIEPSQSNPHRGRDGHD
jgi:hypothetical protein